MAQDIYNPKTLRRGTCSAFCRSGKLEDNPQDTLLCLARCFPFVVLLFSHWLKANVTLKGTSDTWHMALLLLGAVLMVSGSPLKDMWHHKQMFLFHIFGGAVLVAALFCLALLVLDASGFWYKVCRK